MLQMTQLTNKIIIDQDVLHALRRHSSSEMFKTSMQSEFTLLLDGVLNDHLRGLDFQVKRLVRTQIYESHFKANTELELNYYDVAKILINLDLPTKRVISNFQNWILMSTEYNLPFEEVIRVCLEEDFKHNSEWETALEESQSMVNEPLFIDAPVSEEVIQTRPKPKYRIRYRTIGVYIIAAVIIGIFFTQVKANLILSKQIGFADASSLITAIKPKPDEMIIIVNFIASHHTEGFPSYLAFEPINKERLKGYLKRKNSLLADEPYFSTIIEACAKENIHPLLLFSIAGQEQGFVKRGTENSALIINNPFNVYHSWSEYNTDIKDSSRIAAITIRNALVKRPKGENAFRWLNKTYAEDQNWWKGAERIFIDIEEYLGPYQWQVL